MRTPEHAALSETVAGCEALGKDWAKRLINGCLRKFLRNPVSVNESSHYYSHPAWLGKAISDTWPRIRRHYIVSQQSPCTHVSPG